MIDTLFNVFGSIVGNQLGAIAIGAGIGGLFFGFVFKAMDLLLKPIILAVFAKEEFLFRVVKWLDDNIIDVLKKNTPESGKELETRIINILDKTKYIINDNI